MTRIKKIFLDESEMPKQWYNLSPDLPTPLNPPLGPGGIPVTLEMLAPVFPMNMLEQEVSMKRWFDIPEPIRDILKQWRPSPLIRAYELEEALGTPAKIYYKNESVSPAGSHKPNTAVPQAWYNKQFGIKKLTTETGAGQWGSALSYACAQLGGIECKVFMVRVSFDQKPFRKMMMETWGGKCVASPSRETQAGRDILAHFPDTPGSLGIAISEDVNVFSPACDAIVDASKFESIPAVLRYSKKSMKTIYTSFTVSLLYNVVGLSFALAGTLSPLVAAIIMPLSTITIVSLVTLMTNYYAWKIFK